ncbi:MAG: hypothetical protein PUB43_08680, partial [Oscillospiraceae bacterium]|nr:hypothetical protein [Oscillospiraceae bacterium]
KNGAVCAAPLYRLTPSFTKNICPFHRETPGEGFPRNEENAPHFSRSSLPALIEVLFLLPSAQFFFFS